MNAKRIALLLLSGLALAGCGKVEDDPQNVPVLGKWNGVLELASVEINGERYEGSRIPKELAEQLGGTSRYEELGCTEPKVRTIEEITKKLPANLAKSCTIVSDSGVISGIGFRSQCDAARLPAGVEDLKFTGELENTPDRVYMTFHVSVKAKEADGETGTMEIVQNRNYWRLGDCAK